MGRKEKGLWPLVRLPKLSYLSALTKQHRYLSRNRSRNGFLGWCPTIPSCRLPSCKCQVIGQFWYEFRLSHGLKFRDALRHRREAGLWLTNFGSDAVRMRSHNQDLLPCPTFKCNPDRSPRRGQSMGSSDLANYICASPMISMYSEALGVLLKARHVFPFPHNCPLIGPATVQPDKETEKK